MIATPAACPSCSPGQRRDPDRRSRRNNGVHSESNSGRQTALRPAGPTLTVPIASATDTVEVRVYRDEGGSVLAGCIELVSPSNKDRAEEQDAVVSKCASYLHDGVGLLVVDIVTSRLANLHTALLARVSPGSAGALTSDLYTASYRPWEQKEQTELSVWQEPLVVGQPLPKMPLWLRNGPCMPVELEETYEQTCRELRLVSNGSQGAE